MWRADSFGKTLMLGKERLRAEGEEDNKGWDGWKALLTQWTWIWVNSGSWWWKGRPGLLRFMGSQKELEMTERLNWTELKCHIYVCLITQLCLCDPMDCSPPGSLAHGDSLNTAVGCHILFLQHLPNPGIEPRSPALQADSLPSEPPGKPSTKSTGLDSVSLLQGTFLTQESNRVLHCRWILYQLSY